MDRQRIKFPYGRCEIEIEIPSENFMGVLKSIDPPGVDDQRAEIDRCIIFGRILFQDRTRRL